MVVWAALECEGPFTPAARCRETGSVQAGRSGVTYAPLRAWLLHETAQD